jgi:hypothetical protein
LLCIVLKMSEMKSACSRQNVMNAKSMQMFGITLRQ